MKNNFEMFFDVDFKIKEILYNTVMKEEDSYDDGALSSYSDKLYKSIDDIEYYIKRVVSIYFDHEENYCDEYFKILKDKLIDAGYNEKRLKKFYENYFSNMRESFIDKVNSCCYGYGSNSNTLPFSNAISINELLHLIHHSIINNKENFSDIPIVASKKNNYNYDIVLYGKNTSLAANIFVNFSDELDCGWVDIVSLDNKIIMMVRDRGHALSMEIDTSYDDCYIKYFIPKVCNINMINSLRGVKKVDLSSLYTTGSFQCRSDELSSSLNDFISKVPMDSDMFIEGGTYYEEHKKSI